MICNYPDTVRIVKTTVNNYGAESVSDEEAIPAIFSQSTGWAHGNNQTSITSDAIAYLDPTNSFVINNFNRLEGMLLIAETFGVGLGDSWYRITNVRVGRSSLTCNEIDNVQVDLKKSTAIAGVS